MVERRSLILDGANIREATGTETVAGPAPLRTQILPHSNGGLGGTVSPSLAAATAGSVRFVVKLPVDATRWRLKIRNRDGSGSAKTAATLKKLVVGLHDLAGAGDSAGETGSFVGSTATTIVSTDQTIPGDGTFAVLPWVSSAGDVFTANTEFLVGYGYTFASSTAVQTGAGKAWYWTNSTSATTPATAGSGATITYPPFDWIIEYECTTRRKVCLVIGDSIWEAIAGPQGTGSTNFAPTSLWRTAAYLWGHTHGRLLVNISQAGIKLNDYGYSDQSNSYPQYWWGRQGLDGIQFDEVLITAGSNDLSFSTTYPLSAIQAALTVIVNKVRNTYGFTGPIYVGNVLPRSFTTTNENARLAYNTWLSQHPSWAAGVVDFANVMKSTTASALLADYTTDTIHPSYSGHHRLATELGAVLP